MTRLYQRERLQISTGVHSVASIPVHDFVDVSAHVVEFDSRSMTLKIDRGERFAGRLVRVVDGQIEQGPLCKCGHPEWYHRYNEGWCCEIDRCTCKHFEIIPSERAHWA